MLSCPGCNHPSLRLEDLQPEIEGQAAGADAIGRIAATLIISAERSYCLPPSGLPCGFSRDRLQKREFVQVMRSWCCTFEAKLIQSVPALNMETSQSRCYPYNEPPGFVSKELTTPNMDRLLWVQQRCCGELVTHLNLSRHTKYEQTMTLMTLMTTYAAFPEESLGCACEIPHPLMIGICL